MPQLPSIQTWRALRVVAWMVSPIPFLIGLLLLSEGVSVSFSDVGYVWTTEGPFTWRYAAKDLYILAAFVDGLLLVVSAIIPHVMAPYGKRPFIIGIAISASPIGVILFGMQRVPVEWMWAAFGGEV